MLGVELKPIAPDEFRKNHQTRYRGGLSVTAVRPNSPAASQGIVPGDVLVGMHIWETVTLENVAYILKRPDFASLSPVKFFILRGDETLYGYLPRPPPKPRSGKPCLPSPACGGLSRFLWQEATKMGLSPSASPVDTKFCTVPLAGEGPGVRAVCIVRSP